MLVFLQDEFQNPAARRRLCLTRGRHNRSKRRAFRNVNLELENGIEKAKPAAA